MVTSTQWTSQISTYIERDWKREWSSVMGQKSLDGLHIVSTLNNFNFKRNVNIKIFKMKRKVKHRIKRLELLMLYAKIHLRRWMQVSWRGLFMRLNELFLLQELPLNWKLKTVSWELSGKGHFAMNDWRIPLHIPKFLA